MYKASSSAYPFYEVKFMKQLKCFTIIGIVFVLIAGSLAHFLYDWTGGNDIVGLFVPINESIWEHMKLLFFPMLLYSLIMISTSKDNRLCIASSYSFGILAGTFLIPILYYAYVSVLGKSVFALDIIIFILSILIAFVLSYKLSLSCRLKPYTFLLAGFVFLLLVCFIIFTYHPLDFRIYEVPPL